MTDRELLELAAKAAGIVALYWSDGDEPYSRGPGIIFGDNWIWNPLTDDGDALRLAVKLRFEIDIHYTGIAVRTPTGIKVLVDAADEPDANAATRRAIVRAAAAIGQAMSERAG
jgi:hypothetical protein